MSSFSRRTCLTILAAAPLVACGFAPVYGPGGAGTALRNRVRIEPPVTRLEFELVARLEERLGRAGPAADFVLTHAVTTTPEGIAITGANDITRFRLIGEAQYALTETASDAQVLAGAVSTFTAYSTTGSTLSTNAAERAAEDRLMVALADQIVSQLVSGAARLT